jgi:hypothetical protein
MSTYVFPGVSPFIKRVAIGDPLVTAPHLAKADSVWHVGQVQNSLGQMSRVDPKIRGTVYQHTLEIRQSLAAVLGGIDAAIAECREHYPTAEDLELIAAEEESGRTKGRKGAKG